MSILISSYMLFFNLISVPPFTEVSLQQARHYMKFKHYKMQTVKISFSYLTELILIPY